MVPVVAVSKSHRVAQTGILAALSSVKDANNATAGEAGGWEGADESVTAWNPLIDVKADDDGLSHA